MSMAGATVAAGAISAGGGIASQLISAGINKRNYEKYNLHEPEYRAASLRAAGINPLLSDMGGGLGSPPIVDIQSPDLGRTVSSALEAKASEREAVTNALQNKLIEAQIAKANQENKNLSAQEGILLNQMRASGNEADAADYNLYKQGYQPAKIYWDTKLANLRLTNASANSAVANAIGIDYDNVEKEANKDLWKTLGPYGKAARFLREMMPFKGK